jgi:hypothetical protein
MASTTFNLLLVLNATMWQQQQQQQPAQVCRIEAALFL